MPGWAEVGVVRFHLTNVSPSTTAELMPRRGLWNAREGSQSPLPGGLPHTSSKMHDRGGAAHPPHPLSTFCTPVSPAAEPCKGAIAEPLTARTYARMKRVIRILLHGPPIDQIYCMCHSKVASPMAVPNLQGASSRRQPTVQPHPPYRDLLPIGSSISA